MAFMEQQITDKQQWYSVDGPMGTEYIPADVVGVTVTVRDKTRYATPDELRELDGQDTSDSDSVRQPVPSALRDYCQNHEAWNIELISGYGARLSAPGYMDCTEWAVFDTETEAQQYLDETYGDDDADDDEDEDEEPELPEEGDLTTSDHRHFYEVGSHGVKLTVAEDDDWRARVREYMDREQFWPNVWFVSDHGNVHLLSLAEES